MCVRLCTSLNRHCLGFFWCWCRSAATWFMQIISSEGKTGDNQEQCINFPSRTFVAFGEVFFLNLWFTTCKSQQERWNQHLPPTNLKAADFTAPTCICNGSGKTLNPWFCKCENKGEGFLYCLGEGEGKMPWDDGAKLSTWLSVWYVGPKEHHPGSQSFFYWYSQHRQCKVRAKENNIGHFSERLKGVTCQARGALQGTYTDKLKPEWDNLSSSSVLDEGNSTGFFALVRWPWWRNTLAAGSVHLYK